MTDKNKGLQGDKLRAIYDLAPIGVCVIDGTALGMPILYANQLFKSILPAGLPPDVAKSIAERHDPPSIDLPLDGKDRWGQMTAMRTEVDSKDAVIVWVADISEIRSAAREAHIMIEMKSSFLASMSHEMRTPMQSVYGLLELIGDEEMTQNARDMIAAAKRSAGGLLEILDDILDLAKVEAGKIELDHFEVPLRTLAYGAMECMEVNLFGKPVKILSEIAEDIPFVIIGDPTRLRQIILNFISNAIKFTERGSVTLAISTKIKVMKPPEEGIALRFEVRDTGIGMSKEIAQKLFQPFTQADNSTRRRYGGTGLGLSICHKLVDLMGGALGVESIEGSGSIFWFEIPTTASTGKSKIDLPSLDGLAIISIENHPQGAKEIQSSLVSMGAKVESVATYREGIDLIRQRPFDVAVVDQGLPDGLGIDLLREASRLRPFMGLILYTVRNDIGMQYTAKAIGAKYLSKPASRLGLGEAVKSAAKQHAHFDNDRPRRLLIAEDTASVRDVLKRQLDKLGVEADFVINGIEALQVLSDGRHGILFTDLHMPDMDGYQLVANIRAEEERAGVDMHKRFPVITLTADVHLAQRQAYLSYGFDECLLKPVSLGQFRQLLIRWGVLQDQEAANAPKALAESNEKDSVINFKALTEQMGTFGPDTVDMLKMFIEMTAPEIDKLEKAFPRNDFHELAEAGHSLKGAARSVCCDRLGDLTAELQESAEKRVPIALELIEAIRTEFDLIATEVRNLRA